MNVERMRGNSWIVVERREWVGAKTNLIINWW